jgi:hypothetical protein
MRGSKLEWGIGNYWQYFIEELFVVDYEVIGSRKELVNDIQTPCHVVAISTGRNVPGSAYHSYFDVEVVNITKQELGLVTDNEIEMTLTLQPDVNGVYNSSNLNEEDVHSTTQFVGKETIKIGDKTYENCDKIILQDGEEERTYWYSEVERNHVKISSNDGAFSMELVDSGDNERNIRNVYNRLVKMSKSGERRQMLRSIRALIDLGDLIGPNSRRDILLNLSENLDWYVREKAVAALEV